MILLVYINYDWHLHQSSPMVRYQYLGLASRRHNEMTARLHLTY
nr:MAG TPA: hypothetical protein [Caudoviricetes sp.]